MTLSSSPSATGAAWSHAGNAVTVSDFSNTILYVFNVSPVADSPNNTPQAFSNSIVFGNRALGVTSNLNTTLLAGSRVFVDGKVFDNSI